MMTENFNRLAVLLLLLIAMDNRWVSGTVIFMNNSDGSSESLFGYFDVPYANLAFALSETVTGNVYYFDVTCEDIFSRPNSLLNGSLLLLDDISTCPVRYISLAKQAGYDAVLFHGSTSQRLSDDIISTGFPIALINSEKAQLIKDSISNSNDSYTQYTISVTGTILYGIFIVMFSCCMGSLCFYCTTMCSCICCILCLNSCCTDSGDNPGTYDGRNREELVESIMRRLQEMEESHEARIAYGSNRTNALPVKVYRKKDGVEDNCAVCVDEIEDGESVKKLPCGHVYHAQCIDEWLTNYSSLCPLCKYNLRSNTLAETTPLSVSTRNNSTTTFGTLDSSLTLL